MPDLEPNRVSSHTLTQDKERLERSVLAGTVWDGKHRRNVDHTDNRNVYEETKGVLMEQSDFLNLLRGPFLASSNCFHCMFLKMLRNPRKLISFFSFFPSLLAVLPRCLRHLRPVRQALRPHVDIFLQRPAHLPHHAQLPHRGREPVHPAAPAVHQGGSAVPPRPLRLEQVRLPLRHRPRWVMRIDCFCLSTWKLKVRNVFFMEAVPACVYFKCVHFSYKLTIST